MDNALDSQLDVPPGAAWNCWLPADVAACAPDRPRSPAAFHRWQVAGITVRVGT